jgi:hypothetical protein
VVEGNVMKRNLYLVGMFIGMLGVISIVWVLMAFFQMEWLSDKVYPVAGTRLPEWLDNFKFWATVGIVVSSVISLVWYLLSIFYFKFNNWNRSYLMYWGLLFFVAVLPPAILGYLFTKETNVGSEWAYTFYVLNSILIYYLATALFSPPSVKYTPSGAKYIRRW